MVETEITTICASLCDNYCEMIIDPVPSPEVKTNLSLPANSNGYRPWRIVMILLVTVILISSIITGILFWLFRDVDWESIVSDVSTEIIESFEPTPTVDDVYPSVTEKTNRSRSVVNIKNSYSTNTVGVAFEYPAGWEVSEQLIYDEERPTLCVRPKNDLGVYISISNSSDVSCRIIEEMGYVSDLADETLTVDGRSAYRYSGYRNNFDQSGEEKIESVFVLTDSKCYEIDLVQEIESPVNQAAFEQVLDTITFQY